MSSTGLVPCNPTIGPTAATAVGERFNPVVMAGIDLPNGLHYEFKYNQFGEITKIYYPTGSYEKFVYSQITPVGGTSSAAYDQTNRGVTLREVYDQNGALDQRWHYAADFDNSNPNDPTYKITTVAPKATDPTLPGMKTVKYLYNKTGRQLNSYGFSDPRAGMPNEERSYDENGVLRSRTLTEWTTTGPVPTNETAYPADSRAQRDARVSRSLSVTIEGGQALATLSENQYETPGENNSDAPPEAEYFARLNVKRTKSYQYVPVSQSMAQSGTLAQLAANFNGAPLASVTETVYRYDAGYLARGISSLPLETRILNPADTTEILAKTQTLFDEAGTNGGPNYLNGSTGDLSGTPITGGAALTTTWTSPGTTKRGKPTTTGLWDSDGNRWIETHRQYDRYGNVTKTWDASGDPNRFVETQYDPAYGYAYPTTVITPAPGDGSTGPNQTGTNQGGTATTTYDPMTGLALTMTDEFGQRTKTEYDAYLRPVRVFADNYTAPESQTVYDDAARTVKVRQQIDAAGSWDEATTFADTLGRTYKTQTKDAQGDVFTQTEYDHAGRVKRAAGPYRIGEPVLWNEPHYDEAGRVIETYAPAAAGAPKVGLGTTEYGISTAPGFVGPTVTTTDAEGRKSRALSNSLGQLARVDEPGSTGGLDPLPQASPSPGPDPTPTPCSPHKCPEAEFGNGGGGDGSIYPMNSTFYKYDVKGNMVEVIQGEQKRYFLYDSLGRLIFVRQPEQDVNPAFDTQTAIDGNTQWTARFIYDALGNLVTTIDAKGVTITNTYDKAGRVLTRTYSGEPAGQTPAVSFYYDGYGLDTAPPVTNNFAKGKLTKVTSTVSETRYTKFDNLGRLLESEQRTPFTSTEQVADATPRISKYKYNFAGALIEETYPSERVVKNTFNAQGDLAMISSKAKDKAYAPYASNFSYTATGLISKLQLGNGRWETAKFNDRQQITELALGTSQTDTSLWKLGYEYAEAIPGNTTANTGNVSKQTITFAGQANPFVQTYKYDSLNRITEAKEMSGTATNWQQNYAYDRYGNRTDFAQTIGGQSLTINSQTLPAVDAATNRFTDTQTYHYDKTGNITNDKSGTGDARDFIFNGDNKQVEIRDPNIAVTTTNPDANVIGKYFYDGEGKRVKKVTDTEVTVFVYSAGKLAEEYSTETPPPAPTINYVHTDTLQSVRAVSDKLGNIISRRDFMPYGEELTAGAAGRLAVDKYTNGADSVRQRFTGYEKDQESGLDFAEARYYNNRHGRFTAVDPLLASGKSANPQTFNRYVYVGNRPVSFTDPSGLDWYFNESTNRYDWSDNGKNLFYSGGEIDKNWSKVDTSNLIGGIIYPSGNQWVKLDMYGSGFRSGFESREAAGAAGLSASDEFNSFVKDMKKSFSFSELSKGLSQSFFNARENPLGFLDDPALNFATAGELMPLKNASAAAIGGKETLESGARRILTWRDDSLAEIAYAEIRNVTDDVAAIAKNTGMPEYRISRIKNHLFYRTHELDDARRGLFDADYEIANAWHRLTDGNFVNEDLKLLRHEYFESKFESLFRTNYRTAHDATLKSGRPWEP